MTGPEPSGELSIKAPHAAAGDRVTDALRDPLAVQIFDALATGAVAPATADALGDHLGAERGEVESCLNRLIDWNIVEPASRRREGGEVVYRHTRDSLVSDEDWGQLAVADRRRLTALRLELFEEHLWAALDRGGWDATDAHLSRLPADLDRRGYDDMVRLARETLERARDIQAEVVNRRADGTSDGESVRTQLMLMHFPEGTYDTDHGPEVADRLQEELHAVADAIADEAPQADADLRALVGHGRELVRLARRLAAWPRSGPAGRAP